MGVDVSQGPGALEQFGTQRPLPGSHVSQAPHVLATQAPFAQVWQAVHALTHCPLPVLQVWHGPQFGEQLPLVGSQVSQAAHLG